MKLVKDCHETPYQKREHRKQGLLLFHSLLNARVIELVPAPEGPGKRIQIHADLQEDFSLNHALSLYLVETLALLDRESEEYPLQVLTLVV
ncbi:DUF3516 domain-containing protein, partial [Acetobacter lovaniensis]|uniref:DUF3516 domain-containing protein n=1 Tax=Acetobacter lovaniensis TaxID=104100 RepID=UPI00376F67BA